MRPPIWNCSARFAARGGLGRCNPDQRAPSPALAKEDVLYATRPKPPAQLIRATRSLAALWENWKSPEGEWMRSFAVITITPNELCARLHNRMPGF